MVYLNGISDPGNLGTILRTAVAFDVAGVVADEHCVDIYNPKTIQAAKESIFKLNIGHDKNLKIFQKIKAVMPVVVADMQGSPIHASKIVHHNTLSLCLVFGNESNGIKPTILSQADQIVAIPISKRSDSLNVATAAGIILYELRRKNL